ncbi:CDP-glucose 4,6-dehydratase [uncultured Ruegeria sp.]|uniref:CDP-glucose 4,6-dehydratase n=1 Tax=uncultured Ruegeria sp. TaxID=259304 RepID=UPI0026132753|nr:CDP-glucose 4,6-dehydratase [uncultured Ruegeria sp.]
MSTFWRDKKVLVTGHTGFKGSWLSLWLRQRGAQVTGIALAPETSDALFCKLDLARQMEHVERDIRDHDGLAQAVAEIAPDVVFHLAAQSLVLTSYNTPVETWDTNLIGTLNLLNALQLLAHPVTAVIVTTDKVYENPGAQTAFAETDRLGGHDPYSASKAATEILTQSWRHSFGHEDGLRLATARAGNVIGGGDTAANRLIPDLVASLLNNSSLKIRNPDAVRPWQHVLEPLSGYMRLAECLSTNYNYARAYNFGPAEANFRSVRDVITCAHDVWPGSWIDCSDQEKKHESDFLTLTSDLVKSDLGWQPKWSFDTAVMRTIDWYRQVSQGRSAVEFTLEQIAEYETDAL